MGPQRAVGEPRGWARSCPRAKKGMGGWGTSCVWHPGGRGGRRTHARTLGDGREETGGRPRGVCGLWVPQGLKSLERYVHNAFLIFRLRERTCQFCGERANMGQVTGLQGAPGGTLIGPPGGGWGAGRGSQALSTAIPTPGVPNPAEAPRTPSGGPHLKGLRGGGSHVADQP